MDALPSFAEVEGIGDDVKDLDSVRRTLDLLHRHASIIERKNAVDQNTVKELIGDCSISLDSRIPVASFTQSPSSQNLKPVLESIGARAGELVTNFYNKAVELIVKIGRWIAERFRALVDLFRKSKKTDEQQQAVVEANAEIKAKVDFPDKGFSPLNDPAVAAAIARYDQMYSSLMSLIFSGENFVSAFHSLSVAIPSFFPAIEKKIATLEDAGTKQLSDEIQFKMHMQSVLQPIDAARIEHFAKPLGLTDVEHGASFASFLAALKERVSAEHNSRPEHAMDWEVISQMIVKKDAIYANPLAFLPREVENQTAKLLTSIEGLKKVTPAKLSSQEIPIFDAAISQVLSEVQALYSYTNALNLLLDTQCTASGNVYRIQEAIFKAYRNEASKGGMSEEAIQRFNQIQEHLRAAITK